MDSSEVEAPEISALLERLVRNRDFSMFMPFLFGSTINRDSQSPDVHQNPNPNQNQNQNRSSAGERILLINPVTQSMVVIEGASSLGSLLRDLGAKGGQPPASKASIEALPSLQITQQGVGECAICLEDWEIGAMAKQMPCKHTFHPNCITKWLRIHGSCPVCRHNMPLAIDLETRVREIWVGFSFSSDSHVSSTPDAAR